MNTVTIPQQFTSFFLPLLHLTAIPTADSLAIPIYADHGMAIKDSVGAQEIETKTKRWKDP